MAERVVRYDRGTLRSPRRTEQGRLRVDGVFTRAGVFEYRRTDGTMQRELRPDSEVFSPESLRSLEMLPVVEDHPRSGLLGDDSARAQGWTLEGVRREGDLVVGSLLVTDPQLIASIEAGKTSLSVGYAVAYDPTPGNDPVYGRHDGVQRGIRGDHLAVVDVGRAGPEARVRMDSAGTFLAINATGVPSVLTRTHTSHTIGEPRMNPEEIKKLQEALAFAVARADKAEKSLAEQTGRADAAEGAKASLEVALVTAREAAKSVDEVDRLKAQVTQLTADRDANAKRADSAEDPARFRKAVQARAALESSSRVVLGDKFRADLDDRDLMIATLEKVQGPLSDKATLSDGYIRGRFDVAVDSYSAGERALRASAEDKVIAATARTDSRSAREKMIEANRTLAPANSAAK